ncbi:MAG TPA: ATP-binding protein [Ignavibacteria bacterium]|nr:ATP-binding protein [Ignavibacteria bacterium]
MINRLYDFNDYLNKGKVLILYGPRRAGKTTLLKQFLKKTKMKYKVVSGDNIRIQQLLSSGNFEQILDFAEGYDLIAIDEAQQIRNIGNGLKILVDNLPEMQIIATGSSSFELAQQVGEPLTGRKKTLILFPFSQNELLNQNNKFELKEALEQYLIYGSYPEVIKTKSIQEKKEILTELVESYLLKDILTLERIKGTKQLLYLLKLLAFQAGSEVSIHELATQVKLDTKTVERYLDLLEKSFVIYSVGGFSRNLRKEITAKSKYYFYDNGVRNGIILNYNIFDLRDDIGKLFENFIVTERIKRNHYNREFVNYYFWRTYDKQEIDLIEERDGKIFSYEIKFDPIKKIKPPKVFTETYPESTFKLISKDNYLDFVL